MRILATITIMRIIEVNPEAKIRDVPLEAKISVAEVKETRTYTKANIKMTAIKTIITRVINDFIIVHIEISLKVIAMGNLEVEAMAKAVQGPFSSNYYARFYCLVLLELCTNIYCMTLGNVVRLYPWIIQGLTFLSA